LFTKDKHARVTSPQLSEIHPQKKANRRIFVPFPIGQMRGSCVGQRERHRKKTFFSLFRPKSLLTLPQAKPSQAKQVHHHDLALDREREKSIRVMSSPVDATGVSLAALILRLLSELGPHADNNASPDNASPPDVRITTLLAMRRVHPRSSGRNSSDTPPTLSEEGEQVAQAEAPPAEELPPRHVILLFGSGSGDAPGMGSMLGEFASSDREFERILARLAQLHQPQGPPPTTQAALTALPIVAIKEADLIESPQCPICTACFWFLLDLLLLLLLLYI